MQEIKGSLISKSMKFMATKQDNSGQYEAYQLVYRDPKGQVKDFTKPIQSLKFKPKFKDFLATLSDGDDFTIYLEKNDRGYLEPQSGEKGISDEVKSEIKASSKEAPTTTKSTGNWETAQERHDKQRYIVRQSSIANAIELMPKGTVEDVLKTAGRFEDWVFRKDISDLTNDVPE